MRRAFCDMCGAELEEGAGDELRVEFKPTRPFTRTIGSVMVRREPALFVVELCIRQQCLKAAMEQARDRLSPTRVG